MRLPGERGLLWAVWILLLVSTGCALATGGAPLTYVGNGVAIGIAVAVAVIKEGFDPSVFTWCRGGGRGRRQGM